jgi:hypothetical protein
LTGILVGDVPSDAAAGEFARLLQPGGVAIVGSRATEWDWDAVLARSIAWREALIRAGLDARANDGLAFARKPGGASFEIERPSLFAMFVPRRWLEKRRPR